MNRELDTKTVIIIALVAFCIGTGLTFFWSHNYYEKKLDAVSAELNNYKARYSVIVEEKEKAIIAKAIAEEKAKTPVREYIKGDTITQIEYVEKESEKDTDLKLTSTPKVSFEFNGQRQELPLVNKNGMAFKDGKWIITEESHTILNVDEIVNRQIANTIYQKDKEIAVQKRKKIQTGFWATVVGVGIGKYVK